MIDNARQFEEPVADPEVLAQLKDSVTLTLESDRLFDEHPAPLPARVRADLLQLVEAELAMRRLERDWPADPQPAPQVLSQLRRLAPPRTTAEPRRLLRTGSLLRTVRLARPGLRRLWYWGGGLALAASLAFVVFFHPFATRPSNRGGALTATTLLTIEPWNDPELAEISTQLNLVEADSTTHHSVSNLDKLLVADPLANELERLENSTLWEESL